MSTHLVAGPSHDAGQHREAAQNIQPPPTQASLTTSGSADLSRKISVTEGDHPLSQGRADEASRLKGRNASSSLTGRRLDGNDFIMPHDEATPPLAAVAANRLQSAERSSTRPVSIHAMSASGVAPNAQGNAQTANDGENEALSVRRNMLRNAWEGFTTLTRFRRWILILRLIIALAQVRPARPRTDTLPWRATRLTFFAFHSGRCGDHYPGPALVTGRFTVLPRKV